MILTMMIILIHLMVSSLFLLINFNISKKSMYNREKLSPFECGFDPLSLTRTPFSVQFFIISLIFLVFDMEIAILIPLIYMYHYINIFMIITSIMFMMILIFGLFLEYWEKSLDWKM